MKKIFMIEANAKEHSQKEMYVNTYIEEAQKLGHEVRRVNLYALNLDFLRFDKEKQDFDYSLTPEIKEAQDNMLWADQLVFVYPLWWYGIPAIMKSFIDKTFTEGVVANYGTMGPVPLLKDKTAVIMQSYDMPYIGMKLLGDLPMKWWKVVLTAWCGPKIVKRFDFGGIGGASEKQKEKWLNDIKKFVKTL